MLIEGVRIVVVRCLKFAAAYLLIGVGLGVFMGVTRQFQYAPIHAHINLLGWVSLAVIALIYTAFPQASHTRLARLHFLLHNLGLPLFMIGVALLINDHAWALWMVRAGGAATFAAITAFVVNVLRTVRFARATSVPTR